MCTRTTYCLVIAYLNFVCSCMGAITFTVYLANKKLLQEFADGAQSTVATARGVVAFFLVMMVISVVISSMLIRGIHKRNHRLMFPWLLICAIGICISLITTIVILFKIKNPASKFISGMISSIIQCVIIYPIYTFYKDVKAESEIFERTGRTV